MNYFKISTPKSAGTFLILVSMFWSFSCQDVMMEEPQMVQEQLDGLDSSVVPGRYIVSLHSNELNFRKSDRYEDVQESMRIYGNEVLMRSGIRDKRLHAVYGHVFQGFTVDLSREEYTALSKDPQVRSITQDRVSLNSQIMRNNNPNKGGGGSNPDPEPEPDPVGPSPEWYLDRIDQRGLPLDNKFTPAADGNGVTVYLLETLFDPSLDEFEGRARIVEISEGREDILCQQA
ncbi:peptidase S8 and S53, subtilisin, kexin, sedolisin [Indibacter alkaliphilus LW1]|uniref:Peptidase S8 and S53, subtilisin, kexin, sedolisin n=1 Tax=Indibacter alkaliphilus (strain CCUG 57479 / KCTC 22604 / LW1) TaxID=1189612 RepID=S2DDW6_INDAL|nr:protease inhibitor I9 family protein [Indibacter alkaliphilus]EOZ95160.1 peptidase S8 and S53, subtilisin, kexin, sedolisin [Indibacter alkaliphilus LW1]